MRTLVNCEKIRKITQDKAENPALFLIHLTEAIHKRANIEPLRLHFFNAKTKYLMPIMN